MPRRKMTDAEKAEKNLKRLEDLKEKNDREYLERQLHELRDGQLTTPTILYKVGDRVQHGHVKKSIISEVIDSGQIYKLHEVSTENNYGNPYDYERDMYVAWHQITPYRTPEENTKIESFLKNTDLRVDYSQRDVFSLLGTYYGHYAGIDMNPEYQRGNVWTEEQEVALIDSIFKNVDIGKFTFIDLPYKTGGAQYELLDGKQRVTAIIRFYECRFKYKGKTYRDLSNRDQGHFEHYNISWGECSPMSREQKLRFFLQLNTGGTPMDPEHLKRVQGLREEAESRLPVGLKDTEDLD